MVKRQRQRRWLNIQGHPPHSNQKVPRLWGDLLKGKDFKIQASKQDRFQRTDTGSCIRRLRWLFRGLALWSAGPASRRCHQPSGGSRRVQPGRSFLDSVLLPEVTAEFLCL